MSAGLAVAIHLSRLEPNCREAVQGILANRDQVKELHLVYPSFEDEKRSMYNGWLEDREALEKSHVCVSFDAKLNPDNLTGVGTVVEVHPTCRLKLGAFESIRQQISSANAVQTHFALATKTQVDGFSIWYGFLVVLTVMEWLWNRVFERNKLIQYTDVRGRFLVRKANCHFLPSESLAWWRVWNSNVMPKVYAGDTAVLKGCNMFARLYNHRYFGIGLWLVPFLVIWGILSLSWTSMIYAALQYRSLWVGGYALSIWAVEIMLCLLICRHYIHNSKYDTLFYVLFPVYFATFPFILVYSKLLHRVLCNVSLYFGLQQVTSAIKPA